jgi:pilus assembly protein FimV
LAARRRRREQEEEEAAAELSPLDQAGAVHLAPTPSVLAVPRTASGDLSTASQPHSAQRSSTDSSLGAMPVDLSALAQLDVETEGADVLSEADIYVAYGRYKEAEDLLRDELLLAPGRHDIRFKLGEVYAGTGNREALRTLMDEIKRRGGDRADPAQWRQLGQIAAVIERGGVWDPSALRAIAPVPEVDAGPVATARMAGVGTVADFEAEPFGLTASTGATPSAGQPADAPEPMLTLDDLREDSAVSLDELIEPGPAPVLSDQEGLDLALPSLHLPDEEWIAAATEQDLLESLSNASLPLSRLEPSLLDTTAGEWLADSSIWDENATKLDLARAYLDMEDAQSAREILAEVLADGREEQRREAQALLATLARA